MSFTIVSAINAYMTYMLKNKALKTDEEDEKQKKLIENIYKKTFGEEKGEK